MTADHSDDVVLRGDRDGIRTLTFNRPDRANAWTMALEEHYFTALLDAAADPEVRAIVVTGAGRAFCPGMDLDALAAVSTGGSFSQQGRMRQTLPLAIPKPIVAAINGACAGIGLVQALMCDVRFCARSAKISTAFVRRGLPAENAIAWLLARLSGPAVAADLLLSGRVVTADEALELGIVNRVVDGDELSAVTHAYAADLAVNCSPAAMGQIKAQLYQSLDSDLEAARRDAKRVFEQARNAPDFSEGVASFREKRPPRFEGLGVHLVADQFRD